ncbi:GNAT family N-acetyltransferase [Streptomyces sp. MS1.AVA.3]|uniref:GNAT family N-acetyltransferase n=1 Tax=Streptomyces decoyicus TaxID=249567 RepID=UPI0030C61593
MTHLLPPAAPAWTLATVCYSSPAARRLTQALHREQLAIYGAADDPADTPADEFTAPRGTFLIATPGNGPALACGGWRTAGPTTAEIKRMYVAPGARGYGLGRKILESLEQDALCHGKTQMVLETGVCNLAALALYTSCSYVRTPSYIAGRNPDINRALCKALRPPADSV